jgi:hypothetical protein
MKNQTHYNQDLCKFGFFRLSKSKLAVDVCPNTLRAYNSQGLPFYKIGKSVFVNYAELESFIRQKNQLKGNPAGSL